MTLEERLASMSECGDYCGIGNEILEILMRPGQAATPDDETMTMARVIPEIAYRKYGLPTNRSYALPHRDRYLKHSERGDWQRDGFVQLIVFAYVLGASRENLPPLYGEHVLFYEMVAAEQNHELLRAAYTVETERWNTVEDRHDTNSNYRRDLERLGQMMLIAYNDFVTKQSYFQQREAREKS